MNKIYVNGRFLNQAFTGVQRYGFEIGKRLPTDFVSFIAPRSPDKVYDLLCRKHKVNSSLIFDKNKFMSGHFWEQLYLPCALPSNALLWSPGGAGPLFWENQVVTIHDVAHLEHPEWYNWKFAKFYALLLPILVRRVRHILTVSEFSKERIVNILGVSPSKVTAVHLGVNSSFKPSCQFKVKKTLEKHHITKPYCLTVSAISERKNFQRLLKAWKKVDKNGEIILVVVGQAGLKFAGDSSCINVDDKDVLYIGKVDENDLPPLYTGAICSLYPSLYEGFGLPTIEAMACGSPVLTSNITSLPEVAGDAAILVDPFKVDSIVEGITRIISDPGLQSELKKKGEARARLFDWDKSAKSVLNMLQKLSVS